MRGLRIIAFLCEILSVCRFGSENAAGPAGADASAPLRARKLRLCARLNVLHVRYVRRTEREFREPNVSSEELNVDLLGTEGPRLWN